MRISKAPEERRAELVQAARELFDLNGVDKTRVSDIVGRVGVAQGVFYYYFASKNAIVDAVLELVAAELTAKTGQILQPGSQPFGRRLAAFIELYIGLIDQFLADDAQSLLPFTQEEMAEKPLAHQTQEILGGCLEKLVEQGVQSGDITAAYPQQAARVLLMGLRAVSLDKLPTRDVVYAVTEQGLGLAKGSLMQYL